MVAGVVERLVRIPGAGHDIDPFLALFIAFVVGVHLNARHIEFVLVPAADDVEPEPTAAESAMASAEAEVDEAPEPPQKRWSLFGGSKSKPAKQQPEKPFVAAAPARPPEDIEMAPAPAPESPGDSAQATDSATESHGATRQGFASLFSRKPAATADLPESQALDEDDTVQVLPKQSTEPKPAPAAAAAATGDDVLEIPAFLRRQAR